MKAIRKLLLIVILIIFSLSSVLAVGCKNNTDEVVLENEFPEGVCSQYSYRNKTVGIEFALPLASWKFYSEEQLENLEDQMINEYNASRLIEAFLTPLGEVEFFAFSNFGSAVVMISNRLDGLERKLTFEQYVEAFRQHLFANKYSNNYYYINGKKETTFIKYNQETILGNLETYRMSFSLSYYPYYDNLVLPTIQHVYLAKYQDYVITIVCSIQEDDWGFEEAGRGDFEKMFSFDLEYFEYGGSSIINGIGGHRSESLYVPTTYNGLLVSEIDDNALEGKTFLQTVILPKYLNIIGDDAFSGCASLGYVALPANLRRIGNYAFYNCYALNYLYIPAKVISIGGSAFSGCAKLKTVTFEKNSQLTIINAYTFFKCINLNTITIPKGITEIKDSAFYNCRQLQNIVFEEGSQLTSIGNDVFGNCRALASITIPRSITNIGENVFKNCTNLSQINYEGTISEWQNIEIGGGLEDFEIHCIDGVI